MIQIAEFEDIAEREPMLYEGLRKLILGVNSGFGKLGTDPAPATSSVPGSTAPLAATTNLPAPLPAATIGVTAPKGVFTISLAANPANGPNVQYFLEYATDSKFSAPVPIPMGSSLSASLNLGTVNTYYFRTRAKYAESDYSAYLNFGSPTGVQGSLIGSPDALPNVASNISNNATVDSIDAGADDTIRIYGPGGVGTNWTQFTGNGNFSYPAGSIIGKLRTTVYYITYTAANGFQAFTNFGDAISDLNILSGKVTTVAAGGGGGTSGGGTSARTIGGCVEDGTPCEEPEGTIRELELNYDWIHLRFEGEELISMHPDTMVAVWKKAAELKPGDRIEAGKDGQWRTDWTTEGAHYRGFKVKRRCPGGTYRAGAARCRLHNMKTL